MQENIYRLNLYSTLLIICLFLILPFGVLSGCSGKSKQAKASHESMSGKRILNDERGKNETALF
jgi:hypothetical protein